MIFELVGDEAANYVIPVASLPAWVWGESRTVWIAKREASPKEEKLRDEN